MNDECDEDYFLFSTALLLLFWRQFYSQFSSINDSFVDYLTHPLTKFLNVYPIIIKNLLIMSNQFWGPKSLWCGMTLIFSIKLSIDFIPVPAPFLLLFGRLSPIASQSNIRLKISFDFALPAFEPPFCSPNIYELNKYVSKNMNIYGE
jgi:hypothetical protein